MPCTFAIPQWQAQAPVFLASLVYIVSSVFFPIWWFQGFEEMRMASFLTVVARALMLGFLLLCVDGPQDVVLAVLLQAVPQMLAGVLWWSSEPGRGPAAVVQHRPPGSPGLDPRQLAAVSLLRRHQPVHHLDHGAARLLRPRQRKSAFSPPPTS